ncbi:unnamed protein product [Blumeria hordei]|uniref:Uncharacterized protein n=1 Tax=Blumeria hordei TaxID=2867405 RepID=A0A383ULF7_BLUHO|nr:unnamed protein product [Blumeria hordei]
MSTSIILSKIQSDYAFRQARCGTEHFPGQLIYDNVVHACWQINFGERDRINSWNYLGDNLYTFPIISSTITVDSDSINRPQVIIDVNCILKNVVYATPTSAATVDRFLCSLDELPEAIESTFSQKRKRN